MARNPYIAVEGVIGVGKTTLARLLVPELSGELLLEVFEENPFLSDFYGDRARYAFQTQIFFLLSRYRQQTATVPSAILRGPVIADYTFGKDHLFATLNLSGDELAVYERVYQALNEKMLSPDLLVYLRADHDVLMSRIAHRDRPYERNMDPLYIRSLIDAYDDFFSHYEGPHLIIDTNHLNYVHNKTDLAVVIQQIKSSLEMGTYQARLPGVAGGNGEATHDFFDTLQHTSRRLIDYQHFQISLDAAKGLSADPFYIFLNLARGTGSLSEIIRLLWEGKERLVSEGRQADAAAKKAREELRTRLSDEIADHLAELIKLSNALDIDLEEAYFARMGHSIDHSLSDSDDLKGSI